LKLTTSQKLEKYFEISKHKIICKYNTVVRLNKNDFKIDDEELLDVSGDDDDEILETVISIPGSIIVEIPEFNDEINIYLPFNINLTIPEDNEVNKGIIIHNYIPGDILFSATTKSNSTNIKTVDKLFENRVKYLNGEIDKQILAIHQQILSTNNIMLHHIETILTVLYGENTKEGFKPVRLIDMKYIKDRAITTKTSAHKLNNGQGFSYGYTKDAISENITRTTSNTSTDLELIIGGHYDELENRKG